MTPGSASNANFPALAGFGSSRSVATYMEGFGGPYGDYDSVAITASGSAVAVWGEGTGELAGPGGIWANRQT